MSIISRVKPYLKWRYFLYLFAMVAGWPCVFCFMGWLPSWKTNYMILAVLSVLTAIFAGGKSVPMAIKTLVFVQLLTFVLYFFIHSDSSYITRCAYLVTAYSLLVIQMRRPQTEFVDTNVSFLTIQALMGGVGFVLVMAGVLPVLSTFQEFDGHIGQFYGLFTTTVSTDGMVRVAGFFDEPGAFAFWGIMALLFNKLFIDNKKVELALIVGLVSTLSMAYFIQIAMYAFFFYRNRILKMFGYSLLFIVLLLIIASVSPELDNAIFGRFQIDAETGQMSGDNRTSHALSCLAIWKTAPIFGVGANNSIAIGQAMGEFIGANPLVFFAMDGIIGQIILWLPVFYLFSLGKFRRKYRYAAIILFVGFMQRPYDPTQMWYNVTMYMLLLEAYREIHMYPGRCRSNIQYTNFIPFTKS